ncbi:hypothetical protein [Variovorax sp. J22R115]|uniref:hypothetical protein n=1 Tax=Variovorax sp. J22R115 TaxID=3053509 RepID=UPI0025765298|nr:hypothetical protein [Variovorax sp. J22R115]MDM0049712.1 hypothetical protein [Variovorax sp. J22R115]
MLASIRRIAIYVDESQDGGYRWILIEQKAKSSQWTRIDSAADATASYHEAMAAGLLALQVMVDDLDKGPREVADAEPAPSRSGSRFGFGDLRS